MKESEEAATEGEGGEDDVLTGPWVTLMANSTYTCMLFIGKTHVYYFRTFITAGAYISCYFSRQKMEKALFY